MSEGLSVLILGFGSMGDLGLSGWAVFLLFFLALMFSSYVKIISVLGMLRLGLGLENFSAVVMTVFLSLSLTYFVMAPTMEKAAREVAGSLKTKAVVSDKDKQQALSAGIEVWRGFVAKHVEEADVLSLSEIAKRNSPEVSDAAELAKSWRILAPAFMLSELRKALRTGLNIILPFLLIDLLVAAILLSLGAERVNITLIALPIKVALFVTLDAWKLIAENLLATYS